MEKQIKIITERQKDKKFEEITDELETGFNFSRNEDEHVLYAL